MIYTVAWIQTCIGWYEWRVLLKAINVHHSSELDLIGREFKLEVNIQEVIYVFIYMLVKLDKEGLKYYLVRL